MEEFLIALLASLAILATFLCGRRFWRPFDYRPGVVDASTLRLVAKDLAAQPTDGNIQRACNAMESAARWIECDVLHDTVREAAWRKRLRGGA